jgi:phospholipid transport system transporter-binding protein
VIRREGDVFLVEGPVTVANVETVLAEGQRLFDGPQVRVDLARMTEVDSSAVSLLLEWSRQAARNGRRLIFLNPNANLRSLAALYGVSDLVPVA